MTGPLEVVDVTQCYSPTSGGIRTYLHAKADWAARRGAAHAVVATGPADAEGRMSSSRLILVRGRTPTRRWGYRIAVRPTGVIRALDELRPQVVVVHDALSFPRSVAAWASRQGASLVVLCHSQLSAAVNGWPQTVRRPVGAGLAVLQRRVLAVGQTVLVASGAARDQLGPQASADVRVSPLGVDVGVFAAARPDPELRARLAPADAPLLLYAGRLSSEKRVDLLPQVLAALPQDTVLAIAGDGAARGRIERITGRMGLERRTRFLGHVADRSRLATLMATADCFVHPNPEEPFGLAPVEALAAGCRVVAPWTVGSAEVLARGGAVLVAPGDSLALADGVARALAASRPTIDAADLGWDRTFDAEWRLYAELRR